MEMNIWFYIFMAYLILQGLVSLLGSVVAQSRFNDDKPFFLFRIIRWVIYIVISPFIHFFILLTWTNLIIKVSEIDEFVQIGRSRR